MSERAKTWGSITILTTMLTGLISTAVIWIFTQSLNVAPVVESVDKLSTSMQKRDEKSELFHTEMLSMIYAQNARMGKNEVKLQRVMDDCRVNLSKIEDCEDKFHLVPFNIKDN